MIRRAHLLPPSPDRVQVWVGRFLLAVLALVISAVAAGALAVAASYVG